MSVNAICQCKDVDGAFLVPFQDGGDSKVTTNQQELYQKLRWRKDLYAIYSPYMMDSQVQRIKREEENRLNGELKETSSQRKRRKKACSTRILSDNETVVIDSILQALPLLLERAREMKMLKEFKCALREADNNRCARMAASVPGCGDMFHLLCHDLNEEDLTHHSCISLHEGTRATYSASDIIGVPVINTAGHQVLAEIGGHKFVVPAESCFLTSSFQHFVSYGFSNLMADSGYDLIIIDPPWINKSVKRKKSYHTLIESDLALIPMSRLCRKGGLVCVWVTNNDRLLEFVTEQLFPAWSVCWVANWIWMKVTLSGEPVCDLYSPHKKPFEQIVIGRYQGGQELSQSTPAAQELSDFTDSESHHQYWNVSKTSNCGLPEDKGDRFETNLAASSKSISCCDKIEHELLKVPERPATENCEGYLETSDGIDERYKPGLESSAASGDCKTQTPTLVNTGLETSAAADVSGDQTKNNGFQTELDIPNNFVLVSVPCALHSKKPSLDEVLQPYLPKKPQRLEMFARNLTRGWTSWGDEPLRHQHIDYFEGLSSCSNT